jgi:hypothetical protein
MMRQARYWFSIGVHNVITHPMMFLAEIACEIGCRSFAVYCWRAHEGTRGTLPHFEQWCAEIDAEEAT